MKNHSDICQNEASFNQVNVRESDWSWQHIRISAMSFNEGHRHIDMYVCLLRLHYITNKKKDESRWSASDRFGFSKQISTDNEERRRRRGVLNGIFLFRSHQELFSSMILDLNAFVHLLIARNGDCLSRWVLLHWLVRRKWEKNLFSLSNRIEWKERRNDYATSIGQRADNNWSLGSPEEKWSASIHDNE